MAFDLTDRQRRWLDALLVLSTTVVAFVLLGYLGQVFQYFGDILLIFFLAWLLAFIISPLIGFLQRRTPLPRAVATVVVYGSLLGAIIVLAVVAANSMASSITDVISNIPSLRERLPELLAPWQARLDSIGLGQVDLAAQADAFVANLNGYASQLVGPLQQLAVASLGVLGNLLIVVFLSLYMVIDRDRILSFLFRLVPPNYADEAALLEVSVAQSFGGFLRGQAVMGVVYGLVAVVTSAVLGLDFLPVTSAAAGLLMSIPFFGPFVAWLPPVFAAILFKPDATIPTVILMGIGWFVVMNVLQPRLMQHSVGIHPIVVLGSVLIGSKIAGIPGAIFGIPIAAVVSAFFFHYFGRASEAAGVSARAAQRVADREGRAVRVPRPPGPPVELTPDPPLEVSPTGTASAVPVAATASSDAAPAPVKQATAPSKAAAPAEKSAAPAAKSATPARPTPPAKSTSSAKSAAPAANAPPTKVSGPDHTLRTRLRRGRPAPPENDQGDDEPASERSAATLT